MERKTNENFLVRRSSFIETPENSRRSSIVAGQPLPIGLTPSSVRQRRPSFMSAKMFEMHQRKGGSAARGMKRDDDDESSMHSSDDASQKSTISEAIPTEIMARVAKTELKPTPEEYDTILRKPVRLRNKEDVFKLAMLTKGIKFFQKLSDDVTVSLAKVMDILVVKQGERVFSQGDFGDKFYICLSGKVSIVKELPFSPGEDRRSGWTPPPIVRDGLEVIEDDEEEEEESESESESLNTSQSLSRSKSRHASSKISSVAPSTTRTKSQVSSNRSVVSGENNGSEKKSASEKEEGKQEEGDEEEDDDDGDTDSLMLESEGRKIGPKEQALLNQLQGIRAKIKSSQSYVNELQMEGNSETLANEQSYLRRLKDERVAITKSIQAIRLHGESDSSKKVPMKMLFLVQLGAGDTFGEIALESEDCQRTATVIAMMETRFVTIQKEDYDAVLKQVMETKRKQDVEFLRTVSCFQTWSDEQLSALRPLMAVVNMAHGTSVVVEGKKAHCLYILRSGRIRVAKRCSRHPLDAWKSIEKDSKHGFESHDHNHGPVSNSGVDVQIAILGPGQVFGEKSILLNEMCEETVTVDSGVAQLWSLSKVDVMRKFDPQVREDILRDAEQKKFFRKKRLESIITTMLRQARDEESKKRGAILVPYPESTELQKLSREKPQFGKKPAPAKFKKSALRSLTPLLQPIYKPPPPEPDMPKRPTTSMGLSTLVTPSTQPVTLMPINQSSTFLTEMGTSTNHFDASSSNSIPTWGVTDRHKVTSANFLKPLMMSSVRAPHVEIDIDYISNLEYF